MFFGGELFNINSIELVTLTFFAYSFVASSIYCYNDILYRVDIEEFATEEHRDENEEVLYPLLRARKAQDVFYHDVMG